jgi:hypothetical protein
LSSLTGLSNLASLSGRLLRRLRLRLAGGRRRLLAGLEKVVVAQQDSDHQQGENHGGAHVAAAAAAAAWRLKIGIANLGQRVLPVVEKMQTVGLPLLLW